MPSFGVAEMFQHKARIETIHCLHKLPVVLGFLLPYALCASSKITVGFKSFSTLKKLCFINLTLKVLPPRLLSSPLAGGTKGG